MHTCSKSIAMPLLLAAFVGASGCTFLQEPELAPAQPRNAAVRSTGTKPPPSPVGPQARTEPAPGMTPLPQPPPVADEEGLGNGPLGRAGVLLNRAIAANEAVRASGGVVDATLLANLKMTRQARDLIASGNPERAADMLERAIAMDGGQGYAYLYLGYLHLAAGRGDQAEVFLSRASGLLPRDPALKIELGRLRQQADSATVPVAGVR